MGGEGDSLGLGLLSEAREEVATSSSLWDLPFPGLRGSGSRASWLGWLDLSHCWQPPDLLSLEADDVRGMGADFELPVSSALLRTQWPAWCLGVSDGNDPKASLEGLCLHVLAWAVAVSSALWFSVVARTDFFTHVASCLTCTACVPIMAHACGCGSTWDELLQSD